MELTLISSTIEKFDRVRGSDEIIMLVNCIFSNGATRSGVAIATDLSDIEGLRQRAIEDAKSQLNMLSYGGTKSSIPEKLVKVLITPQVDSEIKKIRSRDEYDKLHEIADEEKQKKIATVCDVLGIDIIDVSTWTNLEVFVLLNALENMTIV